MLYIVLSRFDMLCLSVIFLDQMMTQAILFIRQNAGGKRMKKWHIEEILYLNDSDRRKLAVPDAQHFSWHAEFSFLPKKEFFLLHYLRRLVAFILKSF